MFDNIIPINEDTRLKKLFHYEILNSPAEISYDRISILAADLFGVSNAGICFIANDGIFIKSKIGNDIKLNRNESLVSLAILTDDVLVIEPEKLYQVDQNIGFFIAVPIQSPDGFNIGAIYAFGKEVKTISDSQKRMFKQLANLVIDLLETRIAIRKTLTAQDDRLHVLIHDLKNPMTTISLQSELVTRMPSIDEKAGLIAGKINMQAKRMVDSLNEILSSAKKVNGSFKPQKVLVDLREILLTATEKLQKFTDKKNQSIQINIDSKVEIYGDTDKLIELFYHVIHNSIKFSGPNTQIVITNKTSENLITIAVKDQGVGLSAEDLEILFIKFAPLSAASTHHENSNGLGLTLIKMLLDMHKGKIWAESAGQGLGTTFYIQLPIK
ncbi:MULTISPECIES: HAMP domain-containing sensor histidine kinase [Pedobacter]|uniref:GAF domain-containing sensor histidine kinase n=1 Tax=Pedobacter TaxID=84567 RepID=UPI001E339FFB|nr:MULTISPECIES: HAMP domain-containing sensor histidine kinase [Pedobacter]